MFEKEANEYAEENKKVYSSDEYADITDYNNVKKAFQKGVELGYNKANEWHFIKDGDLPKDTNALYYVLVYTWDFGLSHLYEKYGYYIPAVCEWDGEYFKALNKDAYTNARNLGSCLAWKEIIFPDIEVK